MQVQVGQRGEIVIPKRIRELYGITPSSTLQIIEENNGIRLRQDSLQERINDWNKRIRLLPKIKVDAQILALEPYEDEDEKLSSTLRRY